MLLSRVAAPILSIRKTFMMTAIIIRSLEQIIEWRGKPSAIRADNGLQNIAQRVVDWATENRITLMHIQPGKPTQNAYLSPMGILKDSTEPLGMNGWIYMTLILLNMRNF